MTALTSVKILLIFSLFIVTNWASATTLESYKTQIEASLNTLKQTNEARNWAYTRTTEDKNQQEKQLTIETFDPTKTQAKQWTLLQDKGKAPNQSQLQEYQQQQFENTKQQTNNQQQNLIDMIDFNSLQLISQNEKQATLSFSPNIQNMGENSKQHLSGKITFDKTNNHVKQLHIENTAELTPALSVTIKKFAMTFQLTAKNQALLPQTIAIDIYGKAATFSTIDQKTIEKYSNYKYVGPLTSKNQ